MLKYYFFSFSSKNDIDPVLAFPCTSNENFNEIKQTEEKIVSISKENKPPLTRDAFYGSSTDPSELQKFQSIESLTEFKNHEINSDSYLASQIRSRGTKVKRSYFYISSALVSPCFGKFLQYMHYIFNFILQNLINKNNAMN